MNDYHVPLLGVLAGIAWLSATALLIAGWVVILDGMPHLGLMLGLSAMFTACVAVSLTCTLIAGEVMTRVERNGGE